MHAITIPKIEANTDEVTLVEWYKQENDYVKKSEAVLAVETAKAVFDIKSDSEGYLIKKEASEGDDVKVLSVVGYVGRKGEQPPAKKHGPSKSASDAQAEGKNNDGQRKADRDTRICVPASGSAKRLAKEKGIDLELLYATNNSDRITEKDVEDYISKIKQSKRVLIIGGGYGAELLIDIFSASENRLVVGIVDDSEDLTGKKVMGVPVLGTIQAVKNLEQRFDELIISISTNIPARRKIYERFKNEGFSFANAIHKKAVIDNRVEIGEGNVILSTAHIGYSSKIGNNNFLASSSSIDHHCTLGSHCLISPGVTTSGVVTIGDQVIMGAGVHTRNFVNIGNNVTVASGCTVFSDLPDDHVLKKQFEGEPKKKDRKKA